VEPLGGLECLGSVTSTNDVLRERARAGAPEWTALIAEVQTAGRGREGRSWRSPPGDLFLSILLRPVLGPEALLALPLLAGVAVAEASASFGASARLKWPNDVMVGERKLGGVLVEAASSGGRVDFVVVGIGLNLVAEAGEIATELRTFTTSLSAETGRSVAALDAARAVLARMSLWYDRLAREGPASVLGAWRSVSVPWWGERVEVISSGTRVEGMAHGIDESGALLLLKDDGVTLRVLSGDARALRRVSG
jgi:BirA family biotin operon repressor/biotin-[acetyl-CoA-carboxylase] ligase